MPCLRAASAALLCATIGTRSAAYEFTNASEDYLEDTSASDDDSKDTIKFSPLDVETCRQVGEASATILSYISPIRGNASLAVDWGDGKNQTYSTDAISGGIYAYDHPYQSPGLYEIQAVATIEQLSEDGTTWEKTISEEMVTTVQVRNDCHATDTGNRGFEETGGGIVGSILSNWYGQMMKEAIEFAPIDGRKCFRGDVSAVEEDEMTTITLASIWSGDLTLTVDWGDGLDNQYETIAVRGYPKSFNHVWAAPGLYTITATAEIKRPTLDGSDFEVVREELVANVEVDGGCPTTDDVDEDGLELAGGSEGTITGDWSFFDFGPTDNYLCRSAGEKSTALSLMSIFSGELTMDVQWGDDSSEQYSLNVVAGEPYSFDHIYDQAGTYEIRATARVSRLNTLGFSWSKISQHHQTWDVAEQELVTSIGIREGCESVTARSDVDIVGDMNVWFDNAIANTLQIDPLVPDLCIHTNASAPVVAVASLSSGFMNLAIDWGDEKTHQKGVNLRAGTSYSFDHVYEEAGTYNVVAKGYVRRLSSDRTIWEKHENEMTTTVRVRDDCPSIARGVDGGLGDWYDNMMSKSVQFSPMNSGTCHKAGDYSSMLEVASVSSGYMALAVDWGVGETVRYGFNADSGTPVAIPFAYSEPGTYHLSATAKIRRLSTNSRSWEVYEGTYESEVIVAEDCSTDALLNIADSDNDKDGVNNADENTAGTDPNHPDTDRDGASDGEEAIANSDPLDPTDTPPIQDIDFDKVSNTLEGIMGTNPISPDTDGDGASDFEELRANTDGTDATDTPSFRDSDGNGISDATEEAQEALQNALDNVKTSNGLTDITDEDGDGLNSDLELLLGSDPTNPHSDNDGVHDGEEIAHGSDPTDSTDTPELPLADQDLDGLSDAFEEHIIGSDPTDRDTDGDSVGDGEEVTAGTDPTDSTDTPELPLADQDLDGLSDAFEEHIIGSDPTDRDTDGDSVGDGEEVTAGTDPNHPDTDRDGASDGEEAIANSDPLDPTDTPPIQDIDFDKVSNTLEGIMGTNPISPDTDGDGASDFEELRANTDGTDATDTPSFRDSDGNGISDATEEAQEALQNALDNVKTSNGLTDITDEDGDGLNSDLELLIGSDPANPHSDNDGVHDGEEVANGASPTDSTDTPELPLADQDRDGVSDALEKLIGSDPTNPHSDNDGVHDGEEVANGASPTFSTDTPELPLADQDLDGLSDAFEEHIIGSDPTDRDTDGDSVGDGEEVTAGTDPNHPDTDRDGASDGEEAIANSDPLDPTDTPPIQDIDFDKVSNTLEGIMGTNPISPDTDGDGASDFEELQANTDGTDATDSPSFRDSDVNGISDATEEAQEALQKALDNVKTSNGLTDITDEDGDGLNSDLELLIGSDPANPHSDNDGVHDGEEVANGASPTDSTDTPELPLADQDRDGVSDALEKLIGSDPTNPHSDNDGVHDGEELAHSSDPNDPTDHPDLPLKDTDGDSISDKLEQLIGSDPTNPHSDNDGVHDGEELANGSSLTDPTDHPELPLADQDQDGFSDKLELLLGSDPKNPNDPGKDRIPTGFPSSSSSFLCPNLLKENASHMANAFEKSEVTFYYCVESSAESSDAFLPQIEDILSEKAVKDIVDCDLMMAKPGARMRSPDNANRRLRDTRALAPRRLQAVGISSLPEDKPRSDILCTPATNPSNTGYVVEGAMTVMHIESDDAGITEDALRSSVQDAMDSGDLESIETVERVTYLGSTLEEVYDVPGVTAATTPEDATAASNDPVAESKSILGTAVGVSLAAAFILLMLLLIRKKRGDSHTEDEKAGAANGLGMELDEMSHEDGWDGDDVENGMTNQDESGSFHLGRYHYHSDGRRYYSKNCSVCAEMIAQYGEELYQESSFSRADSKDLSKTHSAVDVHNCTSATCLRCNNDLGAAPEVTFIKANGAICEPIAEETEEGAEF